MLDLQVVLVVRGTISLADALTDLSGHLVPFNGRTSHEPGDHLDEKGSGAAGSDGGSEQVCKPFYFQG